MTTTNATIKDAVDETADDARSKVGQVRDAVGSAVDQVPDALGSARSSAEAAAARLPDAAERARAGVEETTTRLQTLPDDTLRLMVAASIGFAAGLYFAGAPRVFTLAAAAPAALAGGAIATRSSRPRSSVSRS